MMKKHKTMVSVAWDCYEAALLVELFDKISSSEIGVEEGISCLSDKLKERLKNSELAVSDSIRNIESIEKRFFEIKAYVNDSENSTNSICVRLYIMSREDPRLFKTILEIAKASDKKILKIPDLYLIWLKVNFGEVASDIYAETQKVDKILMEKQFISTTIFEIRSSESLREVLEKLNQLKADFFLPSVVFFKFSFHRDEREKIEAKKRKIYSLQTYINFVAYEEKRIKFLSRFVATKNDNRKELQTTDFLLSEEPPLDYSYRATDDTQLHRAEDENNLSPKIQRLFGTDFDNPPSLAYTKPISFSYENVKDSTVKNWTDLYVRFFRKVYEEYGTIIPVDTSFFGAERIDFGSCSGMATPRLIKNDLYLETNLSATDVVRKISAIMNICNVARSIVCIEYVKKNQSGDFCEKNTSIKKENVSNDAELTIDKFFSEKYSQLYAKLYSASKVYDAPAGMDLQKICRLIGSSENDIVEQILKKVSWATELEDGRFSFSKNILPVKKEYESVTITDFDKERYIETLLKRYRNGMIFDSIDFDIFREMYKTLFNEDILFNDSELESRLRYCGVIYKDRLFPAEGIIDGETKEKLYSYIETSFASGKKVLYYKAIFEDLSDDFATCYSLADEEMLKAYIAFTAPKNQYFFSKDYLSKEKSVEINHNTEVSDYLLSVGKPIDKDEVCAALSHIPQDKVYQIISFDSRFLRNSKGEYFHTDIFEINESELQKIAEFIEESIKENEYAIWTDIWNRIQKEMPIFLENNLYLSGLGVRNAIAKRYAGTYDFNGAVISSMGKNYAIRDIYQLFAKHHDTFTAEELYNLSKELDTVIYHEALAEVSVRVNHDLFVSKKLIHFQVEVIDKCIESFIAGDYIRIRAIDSFLTFPSVEYEWNEYMLESYLISFSKKYTLLNNGMAFDNVAGIIVKKGGRISEFEDACAIILADSEVELKKSTALDYLANVNIITRRSYREIDTAIKMAKQIRTRKG